MDKKKIFVGILAIILGILTGLQYYETNKDKTTEEIIETTINEVQEIINQSTTEIPKLTELDEQTLEFQETENETFELQGEIAYEGDASSWNLFTDNNPQLTYISQVDSRWKNYPYTSTRKQ